MGIVVLNHALLFCTLRKWQHFFNRYFFFVFCHIFNSKLQTDGKNSKRRNFITHKPNTRYKVNGWLKCAAAVRTALASSGILTLASMIMSLCHFCDVNNIVYVNGGKRSPFHTLFLDYFECADSTLHSWMHFAHICTQNIQCLQRTSVVPMLSQGTKVVWKKQRFF